MPSPLDAAPSYYIYSYITNDASLQSATFVGHVIPLPAFSIRVFQDHDWIFLKWHQP